MKYKIFIKNLKLNNFNNFKKPFFSTLLPIFSTYEEINYSADTN